MRIILLHGVGGGAAIWGDGEGSGTVAALRAAGHDALAIDFPGYGANAGAAAIDMDTFVAAVEASIGGDRALILGHSMGGMVAQELAARRPDRIAGLVLACTSAAFGKPDGAWQARFVAERVAPLDQGLGMAGVAARLVPGLVHERTGDAPRRAATAVMSRVPEATYRAALQAIVAFDRREALQRIAVPTLLVAGDADRTAPPEVMRRMAERIPGSEFTVLADAGHIAPIEQPAAFHAALLGFIARRF